MAKAKKKVILPPVDVPGRKVSWKPNSWSDKLYGEVIAVKLRSEPHPKYYRVLKTVIHVLIPDGRIFKLDAEPEDLKKIGMVAETLNED